MLFKSGARILFVDPHSKAVETDEMLDIILSPALYWVRRQSLPVRYLREVKRLLPSLFEESLPRGNYSYGAYKSGEEYLLFAYNDRAIVDLLASKGIKAAQIRNVYFAQSEFEGMERPVLIDDATVLALQEGIVVRLPAALVADAEAMDLEGHPRSSERVDLARYAHIANRGSMLRFGAFTGVLSLLFALEWGIVASKSADLEAERGAIFEHYGLKSTQMQNQAILDRLESLYGRQNALRGAAAALLEIKLGKDEQLNRFEIGKKVLKATFVIARKERADAVVAALKKEGYAPVSRYDNGTLELEVAL